MEALSSSSPSSADPSLSHDGAAPPSSSAPPAAKKRKPRGDAAVHRGLACTGCRAMKTRCVGAPCSRCVRAGRTCDAGTPGAAAAAAATAAAARAPRPRRRSVQADVDDGASFASTTAPMSPPTPVHVPDGVTFEAAVARSLAAQAALGSGAGGGGGGGGQGPAGGASAPAVGAVPHMATLAAAAAPTLAHCRAAQPVRAPGPASLSSDALSSAVLAEHESLDRVACLLAVFRDWKVQLQQQRWTAPPAQIPQGEREQRVRAVLRFLYFCQDVLQVRRVPCSV